MLLDAAWLVLHAFSIVVLVYFVVLNGYYFISSILSFRALRRYARTLRAADTADLIRYGDVPPVTVLVPAYNESANCLATIKSLLDLEYPDFEILFVNDGSTDQTLSLIADAYRLEPSERIATSALGRGQVRGIYQSATAPRLWVIDKENGGKPDALNVGLDHCHTPLFCALDADTALERDALLRLCRSFLENGDTVAAGGIVRVANGSVFRDGHVRDVRLPDKWLARLQVMEYLRAFLAGRMGWSSMDVLLIVSGAFGMFRREMVVSAGGYSSRTVGEDMELIVRLHRHLRERKQRYAISFVPDPVAWTEVPDGWRVLTRQRDRWQRGLLQSLSQHRRMLLNPRYGRIGMIAFPYFWFMEGLGPVVEFFGYVAFVLTILLGWAAPWFVLAFLLLAIFSGIALSLAAVALEELSFRRYHRRADFARLMACAVLENFGYRQLLTFARFRGVLMALIGRMSWGAMEKRGVLRQNGATEAQAAGRGGGRTAKEQRRPAAALNPDRLTPDNGRLTGAVG
ncbi:MAG: glycosyltransferase family 2 protein [Gemmatimonadetes bacterium]|nr:glycosyltransferase family 2 protein [Gemmatimonadota bacterium]